MTAVRDVAEASNDIRFILKDPYPPRKLGDVYPGCPLTMTGLTNCFLPGILEMKGKRQAYLYIWGDLPSVNFWRRYCQI